MIADETPDDSVFIPVHYMVFEDSIRGSPNLWDSWLHENSHHAGFVDEAKAESLEACATRNEQREDSIWKEKKKQDKEEEEIRGGGGDPTGEGTTIGGEVRTECHVCVYERRIRCWVNDDGDLQCWIWWVLVGCEYVGDGDCDNYFGFAPGAFPGRQPELPPGAEGAAAALAMAGNRTGGCGVPLLRMAFSRGVSKVEIELAGPWKSTALALVP